MTDVDDGKVVIHNTIASCRALAAFVQAGNRLIYEVLQPLFGHPIAID